MKKLLFLTIAAVIGGGIIWQYLPPAVRSKATAFAGAALSGNTTELKKLAGSTLSFEDQSAKRRVLLGKLETNINAVKKQLLKGGVSDASTEDALAGSEKIIADLKDTTDNPGIIAETEKRILDRIFPAKAPVSCPTAP